MVDLYRKNASSTRACRRCPDSFFHCRRPTRLTASIVRSHAADGDPRFAIFAGCLRRDDDRDPTPSGGFIDCLRVIGDVRGHAGHIVGNLFDQVDAFRLIPNLVSADGWPTNTRAPSTPSGVVAWFDYGNRSGVEVADDYTVSVEDCALPSANILFSTVHPTIASRCCASNPLARRRPPRIRLYRSRRS